MRGNGLDRCRDRTYQGFLRFVGLAILGRNLHVLGKILIQKTHPILTRVVIAWFMYGISRLRMLRWLSAEVPGALLVLDTGGKSRRM